MNNLLINREWKIEGNWYAPRNFLNDFTSVIDVELWNTTSSAGDWSGYFVQKIGKIFYMIPFWQTNNRGSFTLATGNVSASWQGEMTQDEKYQIFNDYESAYCG